MTGAIIEKGNTDAGLLAKSSREFVITRVFDAVSQSGKSR
jgi:hypothetical protein